MYNLESKNSYNFSNQGLVLFFIRNTQAVKLFITYFPSYTTIPHTVWSVELNGR